MNDTIRYNRSVVDSLRRMAVLAKVVEAGSFKGAAERLALSPSVVSHHISELEEMVGSDLLHRSTREVALTADGAIFLAAAKEMLRAVNGAFDQVANRTNSIGGELRVALPTALSRARFLKAITQLEEEFPQVTLSFSFSDNAQGVLDKDCDVALFFGSIKSAGLTMRKVVEVERKIVASKAYFEDRDMPEKPSDLKSCDWIWPKSEKKSLYFRDTRRKNATQRISVSPRTLVDNSMACRRLALEGVGLTVIAGFVVEEDIADGRLIQLLPHMRISSEILMAAWPAASTKTTLTHLFMEFIFESMTKNA